MSLDHEVIRPIAICVFSDNGRILVAEYFNIVKQQTFYRPLGGGIDFGEPSSATIAREMQEEMGIEVTDLRYLATLENIFVHHSRPGHEIVQVYDGALVDKTLYQQSRLYGKEDNGAVFTAVWKNIADFQAENAPPLYPNGLLALLTQQTSQ